MVFLKINDMDDDKIKKLKKYYSSKANIFMLVYMNGCGPCNATKPEWSKLENVLHKHKNNEQLVIVDVDKDFLPKIQLDNFDEPMGFPTIVHIHQKKQEPYEDAPGFEKDRTVDSFVQWIQSKTGKPSLNRHFQQRQTQKGGIFISNSANDNSAFEDFLQNSQISVLFSGAFGITFTAKLNPGTTTSYRYLREEKFREPLQYLLIKLCCLFDKEKGEMSEVLDFGNPSQELKLRTVDMESFKNEINIQTDIFFKTFAYLQPICPAIVHAEAYQQMTVNTILGVLSSTLDAPYKEVLSSIHASYQGNEFSSLGIIAMEFAENYTEFVDAYNNAQSKTEQLYVTTISQYALIELAMQTGYTHGDFHPSNIMINMSNNIYFYNLSGQVLLIDFGMAQKIEPSIMANIKELYETNQYMEIIQLLCEIRRPDGVYMKKRRIYELLCNKYSVNQTNRVNSFIQHELIPMREQFINELVKQFDNLHQTVNNEYPYLPLSNEAKNHLYQGMIGGKKRHVRNRRTSSLSLKKNRTHRKKNPKKTHCKSHRGGKWSLKYKRSIDCNHPKGFSQKQHCKYGRKK